MFRGRFLAGLLCIFLLTTFALCNMGIKSVVPISIATGFILLAVIAASGAVRNKKALRYIIFILVAIILSSAHYTAFYFINEKPVRQYSLAANNSKEFYIRARVVKVAQGSFYTRFDLRLIEIDGEKINYGFKLNLFVYKIVDAAIDDIVETVVIFKEIADSGDTLYNKSNGYFITAEVAESIESDDGNDGEFPRGFRVIPAESYGLFYHLDRLQNHAWKIFSYSIKPNNDEEIKENSFTQEAALVYGVFIGRTEFMQQRVKTDFNRTGIAHVFSVSGLHMSIIMGSLYSFFRRLGIHKKMVCVIIVFLCLLFMAFTGFTVSVVRSGIMIILYYLAFLGGRKNDSVTSLMVAAFIICAAAPYNSLNLGFQLSFLATLGIVVTSRINYKIAAKIPAISLTDKKPMHQHPRNARRSPFRKVKRSSRRIFQSVVLSMLITLSATAFTLPLTSYRFKTLSLVSPVVNLITSPLSTLILIFSLLLLLLSAIPVVMPAVLLILGMPLYFFSKAILNITAFFSQMKYSCISVSSTSGDMFSLISLIFFILIILFFIVYSRNRAVKFIFASLICICTALMFVNLIYMKLAFDHSFRIAYHSDYRNQAAVLFREDYGRADIIDMTHGISSPTYEIYKIMLDNGATDIGSFVLTHYHKRHIQMVKKLMDYCTVDRVFAPYPKTDYEREVFQTLFDFSVDTGGVYAENYELFIYYDGILDLDENTAVIINSFDYNGVQHMTADIRRGDRKFLYLGIGYGEIYNYIDDTYDVVFYGTHKHNRKDEDFSAHIYGRYYGVLSDYITSYGNKTTQRLEQSALEAYDIDKGARIILCGEADKYYPVFEITKEDSLRYFSRKKP